MPEPVFNVFYIVLSLISVIVLGFLLFSRFRVRIMLLTFWQNVLVLILLLFVSKLAGFFGLQEISDWVFVFFSFFFMVLMIIAFTLQYPKKGFELKKVNGKKT